MIMERCSPTHPLHPEHVKLLDEAKEEVISEVNKIFDKLVNALLVVVRPEDNNKAAEFVEVECVPPNTIAATIESITPSVSSSEANVAQQFNDADHRDALPNDPDSIPPQPQPSVDFIEPVEAPLQLGVKKEIDGQLVRQIEIGDELFDELFDCLNNEPCHCSDVCLAKLYSYSSERNEINSEQQTSEQTPAATPTITQSESVTQKSTSSVPINETSNVDTSNGAISKKQTKRKRNSDEQLKENEFLPNNNNKKPRLEQNPVSSDGAESDPQIQSTKKVSNKSSSTSDNRNKIKDTLANIKNKDKGPSSSRWRDKSDNSSVDANGGQQHHQHHQVVEKFSVIYCRCEVCGSKFERVDALREHEYAQHHLRPIRCVHIDCSESFHERSQLIEHVKTHHPNVKKWQCRHCSEVRRSELSLAHHLFLEHQRGRFGCTFPGCGHTCRYRIKSLRHYDGKHACGHTPTVTTTTTAEHHHSQSDEHPNGKNGNGSNAMPVDHMDMDSKYSIEWVKCSVPDCQDYFTSFLEMEQHLAREHDRKPIQCIFKACPSSFAEISHMSQHAKAAHQRVKRWLCNTRGCGLSSLEPGLVYLHQCYFHLEGRFKCTEWGCDFVDKHRSNVVIHFNRTHLRSV